MDLNEHLALSLAGSGALWLAGVPAEAAAAFSVGGVLIDLDHLPEYWREQGFKLDLARFFAYFPSRGPRRLLLALHGWEWPLGLLAAAWGLSAPAWVWTLAAGWLLHLCLDQRYNADQHPCCYAFAWRWGQGFEARLFYAGKPD